MGSDGSFRQGGYLRGHPARALIGRADPSAESYSSAGHPARVLMGSDGSFRPMVMQSRVRVGGAGAAEANEPPMHNRALHDSLVAFVEEAARQLAEEVSGGAEVPFELIEQGRATAPLYCYRPLTGRFLAERSTELAKLPSYAAAVQGLSALPDLPAYLETRQRRVPSPGPTAWAKTGGTAGTAVPLATGVRREAGDCLLAADEEDPLRAFCSLVARRTPRGGELAWALRRFELGCERASAVEALTDWLLAGRALLADPDSHGYDGMTERLAVICATPDDRPALEARLDEAIRLERAAIAGRVRADPVVEDLIADLGGNLRAILRDVLCGHLDPQLRRGGGEMVGPGVGGQLAGGTLPGAG